MQSLQQQLTSIIEQAISDCFGQVEVALAPLVTKARRPEFGDFQTNFALALGKALQKNPRECAEAVLQNIQHHPLFASLEIAGPGFINITLANAPLADYCQHALADDQLGIEKDTQPQTVVIDYSSANVAKEMHVGHLRSTVIGDASARILTALGHHVIRQNHLGDWGTQFGMIIEWMIENHWADKTDHTISELNALYRNAKQQFDASEDFAKRARERVVKLQSGDAQTRRIWQSLVDESVRYFQTVYERLGVLLTIDDVRGESSYNDDLTDALNALDQTGVLTESQGAKVVFLEGFVDPEDNPVPMIVQKSDGGFLYATTDIAAARYRINELNADRIIYVTDARQKQHFAMLFALLQQCGWTHDQVSLEHVAFGSILGPDRKPYKTREGEVINLSTLLDEAEAKALEIVASKQSDLPESEQRQIAKTISIGAIKYADLSTDKIKDVIFNWDKMLAFEGNTAPYLQNAFVRVQAIFRKAKAQDLDWQSAKVQLEATQEHQLAILLLSFPDLLASIANDLSIHRLCNYLYEVASHFHRFYEYCPVLTADTPEQRLSRLQLCQFTANTLRLGLSLLGIDVLERM